MTTLREDIISEVIKKFMSKSREDIQEVLDTKKMAISYGKAFVNSLTFLNEKFIEDFGDAFPEAKKEHQCQKEFIGLIQVFINNMEMRKEFPELEQVKFF